MNENDNLLEKVQNHLNSGGVIQVTTYMKSWIYEKKHVAMFSEKNGELFVKQGKSTVSLRYAGIRFGRYAK